MRESRIEGGREGGVRECGVRDYAEGEGGLE